MELDAVNEPLERAEQVLAGIWAASTPFSLGDCLSLIREARLAMFEAQAQCRPLSAVAVTMALPSLPKVELKGKLRSSLDDIYEIFLRRELEPDEQARVIAALAALMGIEVGWGRPETP